MEKKKLNKELDWLAEQIIEVQQELGFNASYIANIREILTGRDRFKVLLWADLLDSTAREILAGRLDVTVDELNTTLATVQMLETCIQPHKSLNATLATVQKM